MVPPANPYVFIVGCPRSGTTLLQRLVNAHPQIAITPETHWIPRLYRKQIGLTPEGWVTPRLVFHLRELPRFSRLGVDPDELLARIEGGPPMSYGALVTQIFDSYGRSQGKALVGDKTPGYVRAIGTLVHLWPTARFVHLIRDGRDVCLSVMNWAKTKQKRPGTFSTWGEDRVSTCALWWEFMVRRGREAGRLLPPERYLEIRYEDMVSRPAEECARLCAFLGLPYDDDMLRFHHGRTKKYSGLDAKHAWLQVTQGLRDWRSQMPPECVERFEAAAGQLLDQLGYPRMVRSTPPAVQENAARIRTRLAQDPDWVALMQYGNLLPIA